METIPFNVPHQTGTELAALQRVFANQKFCGDGSLTRQCHEWLSQRHLNRKALLTTSCTHALEMAALLMDLKPGDEVIMPSFTFVSTANAFVLRGARIKFVDVDPATMNISAAAVEGAISKKTRAIVAVHYGGVACDMDEIQALANRAGAVVVEDAAQALGASYKGRPLGAVSDFAAFSFHETKNLHCGEGGALIVKNQGDHHRAEVIREKGTDRSQFLRGQIDKYTWQDVGSSYLPSEFNAAVLWEQLQRMESINKTRMSIWLSYERHLRSWADSERIELARIPDDRVHNAHLFWLKLHDQGDRDLFIAHLRSHGITATFHYVPLHSSPAGQRYGEFVGPDRYTSSGSATLVRLPLYSQLTSGQQGRVLEAVDSFLRN